MSFFEEIKLHKGKRRIYDIIFFAFISSFIAALENMFPRPIPYFRIGFSFIIIIIVIIPTMLPVIKDKMKTGTIKNFISGK